jgi:hypothetical protein
MMKAILIQAEDERNQNKFCTLENLVKMTTAWPGVVNAKSLWDHDVNNCHELAEAAKFHKWDKVLEIL